MTPFPRDLVARAVADETGSRPVGAAPHVPPDGLIVVPVRNAVLFPGTVFPIALGRERSIRGRAAGGARGAPDRPPDAARPGGGRSVRPRPPPHRHGRQHPALRERAGRHAPCRAAGRAALPGDRLLSGAAVLRRAGPAGRGADDAIARDRGALSPPAQPGAGGAPAPAAGAAGVDRRRAGRELAGGADQPRLGLSRRAPRPEAGDPGDDRPPRPHGEGVALARPAPRGVAADERDRPANQGRLRRAPARGDPARADGRHPAPARGRRRQGTGGRGALGGDRQGEHAQGGGGPGAQGTQALRADAGGGGRGRHGPHLPRLAGRPALGLARGEADRPRRGAPHPRRGPFRAGEDQAADRRVPGGPQARAGGQGADPLLRRPAGRRQDLARPVDRPRHGPAFHPREPGRRP